MRVELLAMAHRLALEEEPFVIAVVVARTPPSSAQIGNMAIITASGAFHGWLGGSCTRSSVERESRRALAEGTPRVLHLSPDASDERGSGVAVEPMTCASGGSVEIYLEPVAPAPRLVVFGDSAIAEALARLGGAAGYAVVTADGTAQPPKGPCVVVVATMGNGDEDAITAAIALCPTYLGVVASRRRFAEMRETLLAQGVPPTSLDTIRSPAGLAIGAQRPEEIAISVLAEIVQLRAAPKAESAEPSIDPVCQMTVQTADARHTASHAGQTYYFCCGGCRGKFLAHPEQYA